MLSVPLYSRGVLSILYTRTALDSVLSASRHCTFSSSTVRHGGGDTGAAQWDGEGGAQAQRHTLYRQTTTGERTIKNARMANASGSVTESQELAVEEDEHAGFRVRAGGWTIRSGGTECCRCEGSCEVRSSSPEAARGTMSPGSSLHPPPIALVRSASEVLVNKKP